MRAVEIIKDNLSRDIYGRPYSFLNPHEKYHVNTEYIGLKELTQELMDEDCDSSITEQSI